MKIRIQGNSVRFRLMRSEVAEFCKEGHFGQRTVFEDTVFSYGLRMDENITEISADFRENTITLNVPKSLAADWDTTDDVGFKNSWSQKNGKTLHLLLEKDFTCMDERGEDESDNYPNPKLAK